MSEAKKLFEMVVSAKNKKHVRIYKELQVLPNYLFKDLKNRDGFLAFSKETIKDLGLTNLYKKSYKNIEEMKEDNAFRYYYLERLNNGCEKHAVIIMMNPAFANSNESDATINNIRKYFQQNKTDKIGSFGIVNLYPIRMPKSAKLNTLLKKKEVKEKTQIYQDFLKEYLEFMQINKDNITVAAWGCDENNNKKAKELFKNLNLKLYCYAINEKGYPRHFRSLKNKEIKKLQEFKFD